MILGLNMGKTSSPSCTRRSGIEIVSQELAGIRMSYSVDLEGSSCREHAPNFDFRLCNVLFIVIILAIIITFGSNLCVGCREDKWSA